MYMYCSTWYMRTHVYVYMYRSSYMFVMNATRHRYHLDSILHVVQLLEFRTGLFTHGHDTSLAIVAFGS